VLSWERHKRQFRRHGRQKPEVLLKTNGKPRITLCMAAMALTVFAQVLAWTCHNQAAVGGGGGVDHMSLVLVMGR